MTDFTENLAFAAAQLIGSWSPGIGDPTVGGWLTVVLYFVGAYACHRVAQRLGATREKRTWQLLALGLLALGVNKQLDLQSAVTELGRLLADHGGWYESRRQVQRLFVGVIGLVGLAFTALFLAYSWKAPKATRVAILGAIALVTFVVMRAASFHHFDLFIRAELAGLKMNWIVEMGAIATVALTARARAAASKAPPAEGRRSASGEKRQVPIVVLSEKPVSRPKRR